MEYADYVRNVRFRWYQPDESPAGFNRQARRLSKFRMSLEIRNTRLPARQRRMRRRLRRLCEMEKMSTFALGAMINEGVSQMRANECFVNVGVWKGFTLFAGMAGNARKRCIGVDNFSEFGSPREEFFRSFEAYRSPEHAFFEMDYVTYFSQVHRDAIGFYMYDGEHSYESQLKGLQIAEPYFSDNCIVLVDDTNWDTARQATLDFAKNSSRRYETLLDAGTSENLHPTLWNGVMILRRTTLRGTVE